MRAVLFLGQAPFHGHLTSLAAEKMQVVGIVNHQPASPKPPLHRRLLSYAANPIELTRYLQARFLLPRYQRRAREGIEKLFADKSSNRQDIPDHAEISVQDINDPRAVNFVRELSPDIVLVHGTNLLRKPMLELATEIRLGLVNLHTGLSPYSRGGNCNLFMLLEGHPELVGVTIHFIDAGIDSGDIIYTRRPKLTGEEPFELIEAECFHLGFNLLIKAALALDEGGLNAVPQWTQGKLFLKRTGYQYRPWHRLQVNRLIDKGLLREYLNNQSQRDSAVRLVGCQE